MNQKKWLKKSSAILLAFCMVVSVALQHLPMISKASNESPTPEELGYTTRVDFEDFTKTGGTIAEKYEKGTTNTSYTGTYNGESLNATYLDVDVSFSSTDYSDWLKLGGTNGNTGVGVTIRSEQLFVRDLGGTNNYQFYDIAGTLGLVDTINDQFNLKLGLKQGTETKYAIWINDTFQGEYTVTGATGKILSIQTSTGYVTIKSAVDKRTPEDLGYTTKVSFEDFTKTDGTIAEKYEKGTTNTSYTGTYNGESLNATYLDVDVSFSSTDYSDWLKLGGTNGNTGVGVTIRSEQLFVRDLGGTNNYQFYDIAGTLGLVDTINDQFNLKLGLKQGTETKYAIWINDTFQGEYTVTGATGKVLSIRTSTGYVTIKSAVEKRTPEELGYERITVQDFGMDNGTYYSGVVYEDHYTGSYGDAVTSLHMKYIDMDVSFDEISRNDANINYGGNDGWHGIKICGALLNDGQTEALNIRDAGTSNTDQYHNLTELGLSIHEPFNIKLATKYGEITDNKCNVTYTLWINNQYVGSHTFIAMPNPGNMIGIYANVGNVNIGTYTEKTLSQVSYDLSDGAYLVSGTKVSVYKDGELSESVTSGTTITTPGDYTIKRTDNLTKYTQNISLYKLGDVNCDGAFSVESDLAALQQILNGKTAEYKASTAAEYAADLDNDGNVGTKDLELMQAIKDGNNDIANVKTQYHIAALTYDYLGGDEVMPINGFFGPYKGENNYLTDEVFQLIKDSGVNLIAHSNNYLVSGGASTSAIEAIKLAEKYGLGYYLDDKRLNTEITSNGAASAGTAALDTTTLAKYLSVYSHYENFLGIDVVDEPYPNVTAYDADIKQLQYYDGVSKLLNGFANNNAFINVWPNYASCLNQTTYKAYLKDVIESTEAKVLSFDHYPFELKSTITGEGHGAHNATSYFTSLSRVRNAAQTNNIPFWGNVQAGGDFANSTEDYGATDTDKQPTEAETYWNVNTMLAFGAKGIGWFPLVQPDYFALGEDAGAAKDYDRNGLLGANATTEIETNVENWTTPYYEYAQNINKHIAAIDEVLMKAKSTDIIATGGYAESQTTNSVDLATSTDKLQSVATANTTYGALVGCFDYRDTEAFYVVNYDVTTAQEITLTFDKDYDYRQIQDAKTTFGAGKSITLTIPAGEAVLIVLEDRMVEVQDISEYRGATAEANKAPDAEPGYVFSGWYEVTPEDLGYSRVTIENFGLSSKTYTGTTRASKVVSDGLDMKYLDVDVVVDKASASGTCLRFGGPDNYGITVYMYQSSNTGKGGIYIRNASDGIGAATYADIGVDDVSRGFNLKLAVNYGDGYDAANSSSTCSVTYSFWVNDALIARDVLLTSSTQVGKSMSVQIQSGDSLTLSTPEYKDPTPEELGYSRVTIENFGLSSKTYTGTTRASKVVSGGLDMKYLDVDVVVDKASASGTCLRFGGPDDYGITVYMYQSSNTGKGGIYIRNASDGIGVATYADIGVDDVSRGFNLKLAVNYGDGYDAANSSSTCSVTYSFWVNDALIARDVLLTSSTTVGKSMSVQIGDGDSLTLGVPKIPELDTSEGRVPLASYKTSGTAYAKFVDENVLSVKAQITANTKTNSDKADIRFVTTVDSLNYAEVGFVITPEGLTAGTKPSTKVYEKLFYVGKDSETADSSYLPTEFSSQSRYFNAFSYWGILNKNFGKTFTVTPYWKTMDGTIVYGPTVIKSISMGITN